MVVRGGVGGGDVDEKLQDIIHMIHDSGGARHAGRAR